ncbi:hypothetical protein HC251_06035 [Iamia sp. SCSIO 61187]|uniref:hypothetical protein n=1 Tax=Iamia sp. SCSIO 61187 TaxID=2722752 RepID=UPI001C62C0FA|nr:hypothetical protein [Iamia sp. SCSIO 61187]QYG92039.1 hypothetical protein HC251_06035 [Iamia sp. SCSIO 61187]
MTRTRFVALLLAALLLAGLAACGDDDAGDDETTTTQADGEDTDADGSTTTDADDEDGSTTEAPTDDDETTTTEAGATTTSPNLPPNDSPLQDLLLDPGAVGEGYAPDDTLGDGSFDTDLCEEVTLEQTWDDQAAQALLRGTGDDAVIFQQSVLRFADAGAAEAFAAEVVDALTACQPDTEVEPVDGTDGQATLARAGAGEAGTATGAVVQVGDLVTWMFGLTGPGVEPPVDEALITAASALLAG